MTAPGLDWVPADACNLPTTEQPLRVAEFDALFSETLTGIERLGPTHARLLLTGEPGLVGRTQDLIDRETRCCSFFAFAVTPVAALGGQLPDPGRVHLGITVPAARTDVLAALVRRAEAAAWFRQ